MNHPNLLIVRDEKDFPPNLKKILPPKHYNLMEAPTSAGLEALLLRENPDLVLVFSHGKADSDGLDAVAKIRRHNLRVPIILVTRHSSEAKVIAALRAGASDYFKLPCPDDILLHSFERHLCFARGKGFAKDDDWNAGAGKQQFVFDCESMRAISTYLAKIALTDSTVLITGETGTGKELVAERIHRRSLRSRRPFVSINCAALPESLVESELFGFDRGAFTGAVLSRKGKFEQAQGGTIFLDEIGDMSLFAQAKILRSIESKEISPLGGNRVLPLDIRVIAATNQNPEEMLAAGSFRKDLYYRLNIARVNLPPLRDRKEDIPRLTAYAIQKLNHQFKRRIKGLAEASMACLMNHDWPGNIRELMNLLEAAYIHLPPRPVELLELPQSMRRQLGSAMKNSTAERSRILSALLETNWNKSTAARKLEWSRMTLYRKMAKYSIVEKRKPAG